MLNFITTLKNKLRCTVEIIRGRVQPFGAVLLLFLGMLAVSFGALPHKEFFWMRCWVSEWVIIALVAFIFIKDWWFKAFLLWCLYLSAGFIVGRDPSMNIGSFITFHYILLFLVFYQIVYDRVKKVHINFILNSICVVVLLQLIYMYFQAFGIDPFLKSNGSHPEYVKYWVQGFWGHTTLSSAFLAITLPLFFRRKWWLFILPILIMLFLTQSLGSIAAAMVSIIFYFFFVIKNRMVKVWLSIVVVTIACLYGSIFEPHNFNLNNNRITYLKTSISLFLKHPVIGYGLGEYKIASMAVNKNIKGLSSSGLQHAHNELAEITTEAGVPAGLIIIGFLITLFIQFIRRRTYLAVVMMSAIVAILVNSCSTFLFHTPLAWFVLFILVVLKKEVSYDN